MTEPAHSKWSASGFEQKMLCPGSHVLQAGAPRSSSRYAAEGTAAHQVLTWALQENRPASAYIGRAISADGFDFEVDDEMAGHVQTCIDYVTAAAGDDGVVFADIRVNYSSYLGVPEQEAWGTADVIICRDDGEIIVVDFKYGMGVGVSAERNPQMSLYALGALQAYQGVAGDFDRARLVISQPRIRSAPSEYDLTVDELETWGTTTARSAVNTCRLAVEFLQDTPVEPALWEETYLRPGEKQCKFCSAKAACPALRAEVASVVFDSAPASPDEFAEATPLEASGPSGSPEWVAACLSQVDLIEDWCKAIRTEAERRMLAGEPLPGYKLVQGKRGNRQWRDEKEAEEMLKTFRLKLEEMYDFKLISPTTAEKLAKAKTIGPRQWPKLAEVITQSDGKLHVAPLSDKREAIEVKPVVDDFENVEEDLA